MVGTIGLGAFGVPLGVLRLLHIANVWQLLAWRAAEPKVGLKIQLRRNDDPDDAAAGLLPQLQADFDVVSLAIDRDRLTLSVRDSVAVAHHETVAARVDLGAQNFPICPDEVPQPP